MSNADIRIITLAKKRMPPRDIAKTLGIAADKVYSKIRQARTRGEDIPHFKGVKAAATSAPEPVAERHIVLPFRLHSLLAREAERRGRTPGEVAQQLLEGALLKTVVRHD